ncbi:CDP-Glycerol:Poly(glycerophosphate) glycerophosphotransferase [[Clostridium] aminophilum]|uniref:CDP-Glycerol:Poly(Glycerophosphate) glycerophosphotransferase n=1 Tax=[Clostridium] aminophilum TaxID=1526 RepID=A0A1I0FT65_9FIRM|nr:CDP-glycerol glycerophosphotransferase family protein [[Clostridium] aminophilum]SET61632.1 CDP-Glycerol:Poly(glycerophosphate) glycerophosphotransferase [[Clostridium] aminophilum]
MLSLERSIELMKEIIAGSDRGDFNHGSDIPDYYTYEHLAALFQLRDQLDGGADLYRQLYHLAMASGESHIQAKAAAGEVIQVAFMSYSAAQWPAEKLYRDLEQDERFHPYIIVSPLVDRDAMSSVTGYNQTLSWYRENGYEVRGGLSDRVLGWDDLGGVPDMVVHLSSWYECIPNEQQFLLLPWRCLNLYVPYGMLLGDNQDHTYAKDHVFNKDFVNMMWRVYTDSLIGRQQYETYSVLQGENAVFSGYLKMDEFLDQSELSEEQKTALWSYPSGADRKKYRKVIIAPHYGILPSGAVISSTFQDNYTFWIYLAKKYQDSVTFLFKPHPNLRSTAVEAGIFKSNEEYDKYLELWNSLPNAKAITESSYIDYFRSSDAMIMDSNSFIGEYLYVQKPLLFLTRPEQTFNAVGEKLVEAHYRTPGSRYSEIEEFLNKVVLNGEDSMKARRREIFETYLDYRKQTGRYAHEIIYAELRTLIGG